MWRTLNIPVNSHTAYWRLWEQTIRVHLLLVLFCCCCRLNVFVLNGWDQRTRDGWFCQSVVFVLFPVIVDVCYQLTQSRKAVSAYLQREQILYFGFVTVHHNTCWITLQQIIVFLYSQQKNDRKRIKNSNSLSQHLLKVPLGMRHFQCCQFWKLNSYEAI